MQISDANGAAYFNGISLATLFDGRWFKTSGDAVCLTLTGELALAGGGNISGDLFAEFTSDPQELKAIAPLTLPDGCLHTAYATVTLATKKVTLAAALTGSTFGITLAFPIAGSMRFRWNPTNVSGLVAGANTITLHTQVGLEG